MCGTKQLMKSVPREKNNKYTNDKNESFDQNFHYLIYYVKHVG